MSLYSNHLRVRESSWHKKKMADMTTILDDLLKKLEEFKSYIDWLILVISDTHRGIANYSFAGLAWALW